MKIKLLPLSNVRTTGRIYGNRWQDGKGGITTDERTAEAYAVWVLNAYNEDSAVIDAVNIQKEF